ncbi:jg6738 [Pararge aegeria aegeria]|uniref:Jg6738 protein n=1 Tax=Pararge aegeria aegeria TaxID=348720 RepID=A0A8S4R1Z8_9NEOP|nr:jg6738 [Pararge aegeria aegeria]
MWLCRKMLKIKWQSFTSNKKVLKLEGKDRELMSTIMRRKVAFFGQLQRGDQVSFPKLVLEGKIVRKRSPGRQRRIRLDDIRGWTGLCYRDLKKAALNREDFRFLNAKLQLKEYGT